MMTFVGIERHKALEESFDKLTKGMGNWKMPIKTSVHVTELDEMKDACVFFTGSELYAVKQDKEPNIGFVKVYAEGYYNAMRN
jgi:hypothetical protein